MIGSAHCTAAATVESTQFSNAFATGNMLRFLSGGYMADYKIVRLPGGEFGIRVESDRAGNRRKPHNTKGVTLGFKTDDEALDFVRKGEAEGYTFEGRELLEDTAA
jgi:hypothetical protein